MAVPRVVARIAPAVAAASLLLLSSVSTAIAAQAQLVDRVVAVVDGEVITLGQLQRAIDLFETGLDLDTGVCVLEPPGTEPGEEEAFARSVLDCEIDEMLAFQHVRRFPQFDILDEAVERAFESIVDEYASPEAFDRELSRRGMSAAELRYDIERQALIGNYLNLRFAQMIDISESDVRRYYNDDYLPGASAMGEEIFPLETVSASIEAILGVAEFNARVEDWVADLRRRADVVVYLW